MAGFDLSMPTWRTPQVQIERESPHPRFFRKRK
jgi:hypothetical protein